MRTLHKTFIQLGSAAAMLCGCAQKSAVFDKEPTPYFYSGIYGAKAGGTKDGSVIFKLSPDGSYKLSRSAGGCTVAIEDGRWNYMIDRLELRRRQSMRRKTCNVEWAMKTEDTLLVNPLRAVTYFSFQMSDGGPEWIEFVPLAKLAMDMAANTETNAGESIALKAD